MREESRVPKRFHVLEEVQEASLNNIVMQRNGADCALSFRALARDGACALQIVIYCHTNDQTPLAFIANHISNFKLRDLANARACIEAKKWAPTNVEVSLGRPRLRCCITSRAWAGKTQSRRNSLECMVSTGPRSWKRYSSPGHSSIRMITRSHAA